MRLVIGTDSAFYRHYMRVRRWYGVDAEPARRGGLCKPCQAMLWGTLAAAVASPLLLCGWAADRLQRRLDTDLLEVTLTAPVPATAAKGFVGLALCLGAAAMCGVVLLLLSLVCVGVWNIADVAVAVWGAVLCGGWYLFAGFAVAGGALLQAAGWAAQHYSLALGYAAGWLVRRPALNAAATLARPLSRRLAARRERELAAAHWICACGYRNPPVWSRCDGCGRKRPVGAARRLWRRTVGRTAAAGTVCVAGGFGIVWIWLSAIAKGVCPLVEFLSPDELRALDGSKARR